MTTLSIEDVKIKLEQLKIFQKKELFSEILQQV